MPAAIIGETEPRYTASGHLMSAPIFSTHDGQVRTLFTFATCLLECPECRKGRKSDYSECWDLALARLPVRQVART